MKLQPLGNEYAEFEVRGDPKGQPRARSFARLIAGKAVARVYDPGTADAWKEAIWRAAEPHRPPQPLTGWFYVGVRFEFRRPQRLLTKKNQDVVRYTGKPDLDNLAKAVLDVLTMAGFWLDDSQVARLHVEKWYVRNKETQPGALIRLDHLRVPQC